MNRGFAFVSFENEKSVRKALNYDGHEFYRRKLKICIAENFKVETEKKRENPSLPSEWNEEECGSSREHMWPAQDQQPDEKPHGRHWRDCQVKIIQVIVMSG